MTDNEVLSQAMGWRWEGGVARKRKKAGKITDFTNYNFSSKPGPRSRFGAFNSSKSIKMRCRSVWDHSWDPKPPKMTDRTDN